MEQCKQLIEELKEQLQVSVQGEGKMRRMAEESQSELQEWEGWHQLLTEQVRWLVAFHVVKPFNPKMPENWLSMYASV